MSGVKYNAYVSQTLPFRYMNTKWQKNGKTLLNRKTKPFRNIIMSLNEMLVELLDNTMVYLTNTPLMSCATNKMFIALLN